MGRFPVAFAQGASLPPIEGGTPGLRPVDRQYSLQNGFPYRYYHFPSHPMIRKKYDAVGQHVHDFIEKWCPEKEYEEVFEDLRWLIEGSVNGSKIGVNVFLPPDDEPLIPPSK